MIQLDLICNTARKISELNKFMRKSQLVDDGILWPIDVYGKRYVLVNFELGFVKYVNSKNAPINKTVTDADLWILGKAMESFLEDISFREERGLIHDSAKSKNVTSHFLNEIDFNRRFATVFYLKRALELGAKKLKLKKTKIVGGRMFFPIYTNGTYLVYGLNRKQDDFVFYLAEKPVIEACKKQDAILIETELKILENLMLWVGEVES